MSRVPGKFASSLRAFTVSALIALLANSGSSAQSTVARSPTPVDNDATLKGITAASIEVDVSPMSQDFAERLAASMEEKLRGAGITVLAQGALPKLRLLLVPVGAEISRGLGPPLRYTIFGFTVEFHQALPLQNGSGQWASAITWKHLKAGFANDPYVQQEVREGVDSSVDAFVNAVRSQNPPLGAERAATPAVVPIRPTKAPPPPLPRRP